MDRRLPEPAYVDGVQKMALQESVEVKSKNEDSTLGLDTAPSVSTAKEEIDQSNFEVMGAALINEEYSFWKQIIKFFQRIFKRGSRENDAFRLVTIFLICQFIGSLFYFIVSLKYSSSPQNIGTIVSIIVQAIVCLVILFPVARILVLLAIPNLATSKLRALLLVIIVTWSFQTPAMNVSSNIQLAAEGIACVQQRVKGLAAELKQSTDNDLKQVSVQKMQAYIKKSMQPFVAMRETLRKLDDSVSRGLAWQRTLIMRMRNILKECTKNAQRPYRACVSMLDNIHKHCTENFFEALCEPIKLLKHICRATRLLELQCEWPKMLKDQIEEGVEFFVKESKQKALEYAQKTVFYDIYVQGKNVKQSIESIEMNVNHSFSLEQQLGFRTEEFRYQLKQEIAGFEKFVNVIVLVLDFSMLPIMLFPFIWAGIYIVKFNRSAKSDNYYIDKSIEEIDQKRKLLGLPIVLPLTPTEKKKYVRWFNLRIVEQEKLSLTISLAFTVFSIVVPLTFILADILTYKVLHLGYEFFHSEMTRLPKPNMYRLQVSGEGFLSELLQNLLNTFEPLTSDTERRDALWRECFLEPTPPDYWLFVIMLLLFTICIVLCLLQVFAKRFKHRIAAHYFPDRVRARSIYLYTSILEGRDKTMLQQLEKKIDEKAKKLIQEKTQYYNSSSSSESE